MITLNLAVAIYIAYLIGSLSSAIIVCKLMGLEDPRRLGSKNPGATNVLRIGGKSAAFITLLGDILKGFLPVIVASYLGFNPTSLALIGIAAFLGHLYPIFFQFRGGKGVATLLGVILAFSLPTAACWIATWLVIALISRYSSLSAFTASILSLLYIWLFTHERPYVIALALMTILLLIRHRSNIKALMNGTERKLGKKI